MKHMCGMRDQALEAVGWGIKSLGRAAKGGGGQCQAALEEAAKRH